MAFRKLTPADYEALVNAFREVGGDEGGLARASRLANVDRSTSVQAWKRGCKVFVDGQLKYYHPIREVLAAEREAERKRILAEAEARAAAEEKARDEARKDALASKKAIGDLLKGGQGILANTALSFQMLSRAAVDIMKTLVNPDGSPTPNLKSLPVNKRIEFLTKLSQGARHWTGAFHEWQAAARLHHGEPEKIIGVEVGLVENETPEEMIEAMKASMKAVERYAVALKAGSVEVISESTEDDEPEPASGNGQTH